MSALVWEGTVVETEIQMSGKGEGALLAEKLAGDVTMVRCFLFASLGEDVEGTLVR